MRSVSLFACITYVTPSNLLCGAFTPAHGYYFYSIVALSFFALATLPIPISQTGKTGLLNVFAQRLFLTCQRLFARTVYNRLPTNDKERLK